MNHAAIVKRFEEHLRTNDLRLTPQRRRIFDRVFGTHEHFSAETLYGWLSGEEGARVSRATVYRTLDMLAKGGFVESMDSGQGEQVYEHVLGHKHHDHMICESCGKIEEFHDDRIEELQQQAAAARGFEVRSHVHRLMGQCRSCASE
ncbi:MAG: Fur family ferric uptake transcriptional regulator [Planctomycetota bacterium]|jgi:Fur family ferric uptake transcriptional regulator